MQNMNALKKIAIAATSIVTIVASATTSGGGSNQTLSQAHTAKASFSGTSAGAFYTPADGMKLATPSKFKIQANNQGGFNTELNDEKFTFTGTDYIGSPGEGAYQINTSPTRTVTFALSDYNGDYKYAGVLAGEIIDTHPAKIYHSVGYADYGINTTTMPTSSSTKMNGIVDMAVGDKADTSLNYYSADISLNANFSTNSISGNISNFSKNSDSTKVAGQLDIVNGTIAGSRFTSDLNGDSSLNANLGATLTGKLQGGFYGPNAVESAGTFTITTPNIVAGGAFIAK